MSAVAKGKRRADERTPLLNGPASGSRPRRVLLPLDESTVSRRERICSHILTGCLAIFSLLFLAILLVTLVTRPLSPTPSPERLFEGAVHFRGPYSIEVLNITNPLTTPDHVGGIWLRMDGDIFVDSDYVLREMASTGVGWWANLRLRIGRWFVRTINNATVDLGNLDVYAPNADAGTPPLVRVRMPKFIVPLEPNETYSGAPFSPFALPVLLSPTRDVSLLAEFAKMSWKAGAVDAKVKTKRASVYGGDMTAGSVFTWGWRGLLSVTVDKFKKDVSIPIPHIPGLPKPGGKLPPTSDLIKLLSYSMTSTDDQILMRANASFLNVFPSLNLPSTFWMTLPETPIIVSLPIPLPDYHAQFDTTGKRKCYDYHHGRKPVLLPAKKYLPMARLTVPPQRIPPPDAPHNITIEASGRLIPLKATQRSMQALSPFLSAFLNGDPYDVLVTIDLPIVSSPGTGINDPIDPTQTLSLHVPFPGANPKPHILQELTIRDMRIRYGREIDEVKALDGMTNLPLDPIDGPIGENSGDYMVLASGTVYAHVVLPAEFDVYANVTRVWPDVLLYDGQLPDEPEELRKSATSPLGKPAPPQPTWKAFSGLDGKERALEAAEQQPSKEGWRYDGCPEPLPPYDPQSDDTCFRKPPTEVPIPDPLPETAFARIRTAAWIDAISHSEPDPNNGGKRVVVVQARFEDVPVTVLPGRESRMRSFVSKAIFSANGADAGIEGVAAVATIIDGLVAPRQDPLKDEPNREIELHGLPVRGNVRVGGKLIHP